MNDLAAFLRARLDEDHATAVKALRGYQHVYGITHYFPANHDTSVAMNPRVALAEVESKRRIIDEAWNYSPELEHGDNGEWAFDTVLRLLAQPYADHRDFDPGWILRLGGTL